VTVSVAMVANVTITSVKEEAALLMQVAADLEAADLAVADLEAAETVEDLAVADLAAAEINNKAEVDLVGEDLADSVVKAVLVVLE